MIIIFTDDIHGSIRCPDVKQTLSRIGQHIHIEKKCSTEIKMKNNSNVMRGFIIKFHCVIPTLFSAVDQFLQKKKIWKIVGTVICLHKCRCLVLLMSTLLLSIHSL